MYKQFITFQFKPIMIFAIFLAISTKILFAENETKICFYNPEININNFASLKREVDTYFSGFGNYQFQPFSTMKTFEKFVSLKEDVVLIVSSWHYKIINKKVTLVPMLVGTINGQNTYRKVLVTNKEIKDVYGLKDATLASAGNAFYTMSTLEDMLGFELSEITDSLNILAVPKDIDALMCLGFGVSQAAIVSDLSFKKLAGLNPNLYSMLKKISISEELFLPIVATFNGKINKHKTAFQIIENMSGSSQGFKNLNMLGLTGWKRLTEDEKLLLNE